MKTLILFALFSGTSECHKLRWNLDDTVQPDGLEHIEPPGQARSYSSPDPTDLALKNLKANGIDVWSPESAKDS